jgi:hypothetical protein
MRSAFLAAQLLAVSAGAQVTTAQYGNDRQGFVAESALTARNVTPTLFGKVATFSVDGDVYAQPLYLPRVTIDSRGARNVLFVATEQGSVYAFDADRVADRPVWHRTLVDSSSGSLPVNYRDVRCPFIKPAISITPTPVIDAATNTLFVLVRSKERQKSGKFRFVQRLHALDIRNGQDRIAPSEISASVAGTGAGTRDGSITFDPLLENPRTALLLTNGVVYAAWASSCDVRPYHGWIMAYDAASLTQRGVFITTSSGSDGGIWQGDAGLAADGEGYVYAVTGNGDFDEVPPVRNYGNSILKLSLTTEALKVRDYFTPSDQAALNAVDLDLGSSGPILLPDQEGGHRHLLAVSSKKGTTYLIDRDAMGHFRPGASAHAVQTVQTSDGAFGAAAFWNHRLYLWGSNSQLKSYVIQSGHLSSTPQIGPTVFAEPGATPVVSANAALEGIVWAIETRTWRGADRPAILHAYDAMDVRRELYNSEQAANGRDRAGLAVRFAMPTIAGGRVFVGTKGEVDVYGLFSSRSRIGQR